MQKKLSWSNKVCCPVERGAVGIWKMREKGVSNQGLIRIEICKKVADEYLQFHNDVKMEIEASRTKIDERKHKLVSDVENFEANLNKEQANRLKHSRGKFRDF